MNAKKIMGAVLVAFLAAALFIGAGAAANLGTFFPYQNSQGALEDGTWTYGNNQVVVEGGIITAESVVAGTYTLGDNTSYFTNPTAAYKLVANDTNTYYAVKNGGNVYSGDFINLTITALADGVDVNYMMLTYPTGEVKNISCTGGNYKQTISSTGTYKVVAIFDKGDFGTGMLDNLLLDTLNSFTFTVVEADKATISASVDTAFSGEFINVVVVGKPGASLGFKLTHVDIPNDQYVKLSGSGNIYTFTMPNNGEATFQLRVNSSANPDVNYEDTAIVQLVNGSNTADVYKNAKVEIDISAPIVTATLGASSYFIGDNIEISGTSTAAADYDFYISGTNFAVTLLGTVGDKTKFGKEWEAVLITKDVNETGSQKKLDVGTYSIYIVQKNTPIGNVSKEAVKTVAVQLKQPFLTFTDAPEAITQNTEAKFIVTAEATSDIKAYVFGTNYFNQVDGDLEDDDVKNVFEIVLTKSMTDKMAAGQYFMVVQHPMYDGNFNIGALNQTFYLNTSANAINYTANPNVVNGVANKLFDVNDRQTANAAQALCDALDTQNIDDMYIKASFFIVGQDESFVINEIPTEVAQGSTFTVSGVDTANAGKTVQVTMLSTMFAAIPKEEAGSASFIVATTEIADDGTWEITIDTAGLAVDEYNLAVKIAGEENNKKNVKINVVEAADEPVTPDTPDTPVTPDTPDEPVAPATPGFGALAALAGLGAVAVLLLRRE